MRYILPRMATYKVCLLAYLLLLGAFQLNAQGQDSLKTIIHVVKQKETLYGISVKYNVSIDDIKLENKLEQDALRIYQKLKIPMHKQLPPKQASPGVSLSHTNDSLQVKKDSIYNMLLKFYEDNKDRVQANVPEADPCMDTEYEQLLQLKDTATFIGFINNIESFPRTDSISNSTTDAREFFLFSLNPDGSVRRVVDQRRSCNRATRYLNEKDMDALKKLSFGPEYNNDTLSSNCFAIGLRMRVSNENHTIRIKKNKIRLLDHPLYFEVISPSDPLYSLIKQELDKRSMGPGKYTFSLHKADCSFDQYGTEGCDPFDKAKKNLFKYHIHTIIGLEPVK